jgi:hypothetical protein
LTAAALVARSAGDGPVSVAAINLGAATALAAPRIAPTPVAEPTGGAAVGETWTPISRPGGDLTDPRRTKAAVPSRLTIGSLSISARVVPAGLTADGGIAIPKNIRTLGWYRYGTAPGAATGSTVIVGHVDSATQGLGALFRLRTIRAGAVVRVRSRDGRTWPYRVIGRQEYPKTTVPLAAIFSPRGTPRLTLITCGGAFDRANHSYLDNVVVTAIPTGSLTTRFQAPPAAGSAARAG